MTTALFSVRGGQVPQASGRIVTPLNYFETKEDANRHTGGRLEHWLCKSCEAAP